MPELDDEQLDSLQVSRVNDEEGVNIHGDAIIIDGAPRVWVTTERMSPIYLTRDDIYDLGFLRSNPQREHYKHKDKPNLHLQVEYVKNYAVKDFVEAHYSVMAKEGTKWTIIWRELYSSTKPNKADIEQVIKNYAA